MPVDPWAATAKAIRRLIARCPICGKTELTGHRCFLLASQVAEKQTEELKAFFLLYKERRWEELSSIQEFKGTANAAFLYVVFCGLRGCVIAIRDPFELYDADELLDLTVIDEKEAEKLLSLAVELHEL
jgi:hypothetical protein